MHSLKNIVEKLIKKPINYSNTRDAANELYHFFNNISSTENSVDKLHDHIHTNNGLAVSTDAAAICIIDFIRTRNFILAIKQAIEDKIAINNKPITILYAGTGPFASLIIPLTSIFTAEQVQFILLDINEVSIQHLRKIINKLGVQDFIKDIIHTDASTYSLINKNEVDVLVSETMKPALDKEPQISIISNLIGQCKTDVILIPESIKVDMVYKGKSETKMFEHEYIQELIDFNASTAIEVNMDKNKLPIFSDGISVKILSKPDNKFSQLSLLTYIRLYKEIVLGYNETSLTIPFPIAQIKDLHFPISYKIKYVIDKRPRFVFEKVID
jgi:predicted RNA methylase